jgi:hypothetical protein
VHAQKKGPDVDVKYSYRGVEMRKLALPLLVLVLAALASAQTAYVGTPTFCMNAESCSYGLQPSGAVNLTVNYVVAFPSPGDPPVPVSGQGQFLIEGDHQWTYFRPQCYTGSTNCDNAVWSGQIAYFSSGVPAYYNNVYEVTGTFAEKDLAPGPNYGLTVSGSLDVFLQCHASKCQPRPASGGGPGNITVTVTGTSPTTAVVADSNIQVSINPGYCGKQIFNCILYTSDGNRVWVDNPYFVNVLFADNRPELSCTDITAYNFAWQGVPPSRTNPAHVPFTLHVECGANVVVDENGYGYYSPYKYAGVYYHVDGGTLTY